MDLLSKTLGNYRLDHLLGKGSIGDVYQAYDLAMQRDVAVKVIHPQFARHPEFREGFSPEASVAAQMDHPSIVRVLDFGQHKDQLYVVTECIPGANLRQLLDELILQREWLSLNDSSRMIEQLCEAITYAHERGAFGWDLNPTHMLIKPEPASGLPFRLVLTDLRLRKLVERPENGQEQISLDSPAYLSPEQVSGKAPDARSDIYSLGVLLYEFVVGILPFPAKTLSEATLYHAKESVPEPRSIRPDLPPEVQGVILKALEKEPENRFATPRELTTALAAALSEVTQIVELEGAQDGNLFKKYEQSLGAPVRVESTSLMDEYPADRTELQSAFATAPAEVPPTNPISIQVALAGRPPQTYTFPGEMVTIGREKGNDLVLEDPKVSRRHAQITQEGLNYFVEDLGSANGTYLDNVRLQPGAPVIWRPQQELRMGNSSLRLTSEAHGGTIVESYNVGPRSSLSRFTGEPLVVTVTPQQLAVEAGGGITATLSILNQNPSAEYFSISLTGIPNDWVGSLPPHIQVIPGEQEVLAFTINIPRSPQSRAGRHSITLRVTDQNDPSQFVELRMVLTIAAYSEFKAELEPARLLPNQIGRVTIANVGNYQETFAVQFTDPNGSLAFQPPYLQLRIPEARSAYMEFRTQEKQLRVVGGEQSYPFNAHVTVPSGDTQTLHSELVSRGFIPVWVLPTVLLLCLFLTGSAAALWWFYFHTPPPNTTITAFVFTNPVATGVIDEGAHKIAVTVPFGTNVTALVPTITHTGSSISPDSGVAQNFTNPVVYTVTAADGTRTQTYAVTVTVANQTAKQINTFSFTNPVLSGVINEAAHTIAVTVPFGTNVTALVPTIAHTGASISPPSGVAHDFSSPVTYTVTAADGSTQNYVVTVMFAAQTAKVMAFIFTNPVANGVINEGTHTIAITVPSGTNVTGLSPSITHSGVSIKPESGVPQNFTTPVIYTVTAADGSTQAYTVTVTVAAQTMKEITGFSFSPTVIGSIDNTTHTIKVSVPFGTNVSGLVPTITHTGASVNPASGTAQNFSSPVIYTVTAADGSTQTYTVIVTVGAQTTKDITDFVFASPGAKGLINQTTHSITVTVPFGTNVNGLVPIITHTGASVNPASGTAQNFSSPVIYTVTAADGSTQAYVVSVTFAPTSTPTNTPTPTSTPTITPTKTPTNTVAPSTNTPTNTPTPTQTSAPTTSTPTSTPTATPTPTSTPTATPT